MLNSCWWDQEIESMWFFANQFPFKEHSGTFHHLWNQLLGSVFNTFLIKRSPACTTAATLVRERPSFLFKRACVLQKMRCFWSPSGFFPFLQWIHLKKKDSSPQVKWNYLWKVNNVSFVRDDDFKWNIIIKEVLFDSLLEIFKNDYWFETFYKESI